MHAGPDQFYNVRHASGYDAPIPYVQRNGDVEDHPRAPVNGCVNIYLYLGDEPISRFLLCRHRRKDAEARAGDDVLVKLAIDAPLDLVRKVLKYV